MRIKKSLYVFCMLLAFQFLAGQEQDCEKLQSLLERAIQEKQSRNYAQAFEILTQVEQEAVEKECFEQLWTAKNSIGIIYTELSNYAQSLDYYQQALTIAREHPEMNKKIPQLLHNIGYLEYLQKNEDKALDHLIKAYEAANQYNTTFIVAVSLADIYAKKGKYDIGLKYLEEVREKIMDGDVEEYKQRWKITYAEILYMSGKTNQAQKIAEELYLETQKDKKGICNRCALKLLSEVYASLKEYDRAIEFAKKGLKNTSELTWRIDFYEELAGFYLEKGDYRMAFHYKDSVIIAEDSLSGIVNKHLFQINRVKFEVQEYQNQIKRNAQQQQAERRVFFILIGCALLAFFFIFKILQNRIVKQKQRRLIAENQQKIVELQLENEKKEHHLLEEQFKARQEQLKNKISKKNRMLSANALYHSGRNELLEKIISSLSSITTISTNKAISDYIKELKSHLKTDSKWEDFITHFEKVNPGFLKKLKTNHPKLTKRDIRFLCYLYMNVSTKEICAILNITPEAFRKRKQRLAEKMELKKGELYDYILSLV